MRKEGSHHPYAWGVYRLIGKNQYYDVLKIEQDGNCRFPTLAKRGISQDASSPLLKDVIPQMPEWP